MNEGGKGWFPGKLAKGLGGLTVVLGGVWVMMAFFWHSAPDSPHLRPEIVDVRPHRGGGFDIDIKITNELESNQRVYFSDATIELNYGGRERYKNSIFVDAELPPAGTLRWFFEAPEQYPDSCWDVFSSAESFRVRIDFMQPPGKSGMISKWFATAASADWVPESIRQRLQPKVYARATDWVPVEKVTERFDDLIMKEAENRSEKWHLPPIEFSE